MKKVFLFTLLLISCSPVKKYQATAAKWEKDIIKLENLDKSENTYENAIFLLEVLA